MLSLEEADFTAYLIKPLNLALILALDRLGQSTKARLASHSKQIINMEQSSAVISILATSAFASPAMACPATLNGLVTWRNPE